MQGEKNIRNSEDERERDDLADAQAERGDLALRFDDGSKVVVSLMDGNPSTTID